MYGSKVHSGGAQRGKTTQTLHVSPPHMGIFIATRRLLVPYEPPLWNVHSAQVTSGQRLCNLLYHRHLGPEVEIHEVFV